MVHSLENTELEVRVIGTEWIGSDWFNSLCRKYWNLKIERAGSNHKEEE